MYGCLKAFHEKAGNERIEFNILILFFMGSDDKLFYEGLPSYPKFLEDLLYLRQKRLAYYNFFIIASISLVNETSYIFLVSLKTSRKMSLVARSLTHLL